MSTFRRAGAALCAAAAALLLLASVPVRTLEAADSDLDAFMRQVLAHRDDNWKKLQQYVLDERETIDLRGPGHVPLWGERRDFAWYIRDGFFVRSPVKFNGVAIAEPERRKYEDNFLRRERVRDRRAQPGAAPPGPGPAAAPDQPPADLESLIRQTREPDFISSAYFLRFTFDEGRYALVGREPLDGRDVLRIEYYPATLFSEQARQDRARGRGRGRDSRDGDEQTFTLMNKASRVTLWVDQPARQIVKYTFENVTPNFIPSNFLTSLTAANATMTMAQPFPDVWLPHGIEIGITLTFAIGDVDLRYTQGYANYRAAEGTSRLVPLDPR